MGLRFPVFIAVTGSRETQELLTVINVSENVVIVSDASLLLGEGVGVGGLCLRLSLPLTAKGFQLCAVRQPCYCEAHS